MAALPQIFDLHCDTLDALALAGDPHFTSLYLPKTNDTSLHHNDLALSVDRMLQRAAGWTQCYAIWVPDDLAGTGVDALGFYRRVRDYFKGQLQENACGIAAIQDARSIRGLAAGRVVALLTVENGAPIGSDLGVIDEFARDGVKMVTLTWNGRNSIASGNDTTDGLSAFGQKAIRAMEERRIVVDVSHLNDTSFWDVARVARRPLVASHSNSRAICGHARNLTDDQFLRIAEDGGLVGINYYRAFITSRLPEHSAPAPADEVTFDELAAHIEHFLDLDGAGTLALGSDFDGSSTPSWLDRAEKVPMFYRQVAERFGETIANRMFYGNARDFFVRNEE